MVGMVIISRDMRFLQVNEKFCEMLGYSAPDLRALTWVDITHGEDLDESLKVLSQVAKGGTDGCSLEQRFLRRDGASIHLSAWAQCMRDLDGSPQYVALIAHDIRERKRTEEALRESEERYKLLFHSNPHAMWVYDTADLRFI